MYKNVLILCTILLTGCAGTKAIDFSETPAPKPQEVRVSVDNKIIPQINSSSAVGAQFGLIGGLISAAVDASRANKALSDAQKIAQEWQMDSVRNRFIQALNEYVATSDVFATKSLEIIEPTENGSVVVSAPGVNQANIGASFLLSDNFCCMTASLTYSTKISEDSDPIFRFYQFKETVSGDINGNKQRQANLESILARDNDEIIAMFDTAISELISLMNRDLTGQLPLEQPEKPKFNQEKVIQNDENKLITRTNVHNGNVIIAVSLK